MQIMVAHGKVAMAAAGCVKRVRSRAASLGDLDPMRRYIMHFPQEKLNLERGIGLRRKRAAGEKMFCIADCQRDGARAGWMAEAMLILGLSRREAK